MSYILDEICSALFDPYDLVQGLLAWLTFLLLATFFFGVGWLVWDVATIERGPAKPQEVQILRREYHAAYSITTFIYVNKVSVPSTTFYPAQYLTFVNINNEEVEIDNERLYNATDRKTLVVHYVDCTRYGKHVRYEVVALDL